MTDLTNTQYFRVEKENEVGVKEILDKVYASLKEKGYSPVNQIVGYIMSGDPTYITSHNNARALMVQVDRDEIVEELLISYVKNNDWDE